jgi:copper chaperone CopZ
MNRRLQTFVGRLAVWASLAISVSGCAAAIVGLGVVCCATPAVAALAAHGSASPADTADTTATIEVPEVECAACNLEVRKAIKGAGGVRRLNEGSPKNHIIVTYEPGAGRPDAYVEALHKAGFAKAHVVG